MTMKISKVFKVYEIFLDHKKKIYNLMKMLIESIKTKNCMNNLLLNIDNPNLLQQLNRETEKCDIICESAMDIANESYFAIDKVLKKLNQFIQNLEQHLTNTKLSDFSYQNSLLDKNINDLLNLENFLNSKRILLIINLKLDKKKSRSKKNRNSLKNLNLNLNISINGLKKRKRKKSTNENKKVNNKEAKLKNQNNKQINYSNLEDITYKEIDGKLDPNEPIYCYCNYISYGNMVKCDNPKCKREWFHFHCVGMKNLPKGKWFCSTRCANSYKKKVEKSKVK